MCKRVTRCCEAETYLSRETTTYEQRGYDRNYQVRTVRRCKDCHTEVMPGSAISKEHSEGLPDISLCGCGSRPEFYVTDPFNFVHSEQVKVEVVITCPSCTRKLIKVCDLPAFQTSGHYIKASLIKQWNRSEQSRDEQSGNTLLREGYEPEQASSNLPGV